MSVYGIGTLFIIFYKKILKFGEKYDTITRYLYELWRVSGKTGRRRCKKYLCILYLSGKRTGQENKPSLNSSKPIIRLYFFERKFIQGENPFGVRKNFKEDS